LASIAAAYGAAPPALRGGRGGAAAAGTAARPAAIALALAQATAAQESGALGDSVRISPAVASLLRRARAEPGAAP